MQIIVMGNLAISSSAINYKRDASLKFPASQEAIGTERERGGGKSERALQSLQNQKHRRVKLKWWPPLTGRGGENWKWKFMKEK